jgi:hypothetical protein
MRTLRGVVHGKAIELEEESGLPDGQEVAVTIKPIPRPEDTAPEVLAALQRAAGSWADDIAGLDDYLEWNRRQRKAQRREIPE